MARKNNGDYVSNLCSAMQSARMTLRWSRQERKVAAMHYAGDHWSEETGKETKTFVNFLSMYVDIVLRNLISKNPRIMLSTMEMQNKPVVSSMQTWVNDQIDRINLASTLQRVVMDALFSIGICKISLSTPAEAAIGAWNVGVGVPVAQRIDLDDFVFDIHCRDFAEASFIGHRYRAPLEAIKDSILYDKSRKELTASDDPRFNQEGDERINVLGRGYYGSDEELEPMVDLWEVYCPRKRVVYTLSEDSLTGAGAPAHGGHPTPLREQDWIGRDAGPFEILGLGIVPGNPMPKGPIMNLLNLHLSLNRILRKLIWSGENFKDVLIAPKGSDADMDQIRNSMHGGILGLDRPKDYANVGMNTPNALLLQFFIQLKELFSWMAGNLDIMGGLSPQAKTATQDTMLDRNSSRSIADMQDRTLTFTSNVVEALCYYYWHDPKLIMKSNYSPRGLPDVQIPRALFPWNAQNPAVMKRSGNWEDLRVKVDPYSMPHATPQQRANDLIQTVTQVYAPLAQVAMQQGISLDFATFLDKLGIYRDMPDLKEILTMQESVAAPPGVEENPVAPAPETTTHIRENMPGRTRAGNDMNMLNVLAGIDGGGASNGQSNGDY